MPRPLMILAALLAALALGGCSLLTPSSPTTPLAIVDSHGGLCVQGSECRVVMTIGRDGVLTVDGVGDESVVDQVDPTLLSAFAAAVDTTDFAAITAVPFEGTCPIAFDGQELTYTFNPIGRPSVTFSSCEVAIPLEHPLFRALDAITLRPAG